MNFFLMCVSCDRCLFWSSFWSTVSCISSGSWHGFPLSLKTSKIVPQTQLPQILYVYRSLYPSYMGLWHRFCSDVYSLFFCTQSSEGKFQSNVFSRCSDNTILQFEPPGIHKQNNSGCKFHLNFLYLRYFYDKLFLHIWIPQRLCKPDLLFLFLAIFGSGKPATLPRDLKKRRKTWPSSWSNFPNSDWLNQIMWLFRRASVDLHWCIFKSTRFKHAFMITENLLDKCFSN